MAVEMDLTDVRLLVIENVGNLVCPAEFRVGEHAKVVVLSVTEGEDKPLKYPLMFRECDAALLNKVEPARQAGDASQQPASLGSRNGAQDVRMSQSELDALRGQVAQCWNPPVGAVGAEELKVRVCPISARDSSHPKA